MAHELSFADGRAEMAFVGETPWHGLGRQLTHGLSIDEWVKEAHMEWQIERSPVQFAVGNDNSLSVSDPKFANFDVEDYPDKHVLYRSDTRSPLSVVSKEYKVVQPREVIEFYRDLTETMNMSLETAGVLFGGRRVWALANTSRATVLAGNDKVTGYLLLTTSCDGTLATTAQFTSIRVVCNNTLSIAVRDNNERIKVPHSRVFNPYDVKKQLGLIDEGWAKFKDQITMLSETVAPRDKAVEYLVRIFGDLDVTDSDDMELIIANQSPAVSQRCASMWELFTKTGMGHDLEAANGTWWGLLNAVTESIDHHTGHRSVDARLNSAWYGIGNSIKKNAFELALEMAA